MKNAINIILVGICLVLVFNMNEALSFGPEYFYFYYIIALLATLICFFLLNWYKKEKQLFKAIKNKNLGLGIIPIVVFGSIMMHPFYDHEFHLFYFILVVVIIVMAVINFRFIVDKEEKSR